MPVAALAAVLLAVAFAACGGGGDSSSTTSETTSPARSGAKSGGEATKEGATSAGGKGKAEAQGRSGSGGGEGTTAFKPKPHHDSGGGSAQYRVKGGDNSVQEFGSEAEGSELEAAAAALHGFLDARAAGNWAATCSYMSKSVVESFEKLAAQGKQGEGASCAKTLAALTNPAAKSDMKAEADRANVGSLRIEGERAFLIYTGAGKTVLAMPMADEAGTWKVASLAGTPLS
jgi:hypothetical protein